MRMSCVRGNIRLFLILSLLAGERYALSAESPPAPAPMGLEAILKSTLSNNGQIKEAAADIEIARSQLDLARSALWPKASAMVLAAPIFEERGNALSSTSNWGKWGPMLQGSIQVVEPLYSFGMISSYRNAAEKQIEARTELTEAKKSDVMVMAKEFYYGYLMANDLDKLVGDLSEFLEEAVKTAEESRKKRDKSAVKPHDIYRLKVALDDLKQKQLYAKQGKQTALRAIQWVSGANAPVTATKLTPEAFDKKSLEDYLKISKESRPELKALAAGQAARGSLAEAKRAQSYPILFLGGFLSQGWSPVRDRQPSAYANDPFNGLFGGVGVGLKFDLEFARHAAEAAEQEGEVMKLKATESYAVPGMDLQVKKAFWELEQAVEGLEIAERRAKLSKKWFISDASGWSIGITPAKDLMEALEGDGLARKNYIETVYSLNMALAKLSQAVGKEVTKLNYR